MEYVECAVCEGQGILVVWENGDNGDRFVGFKNDCQSHARVYALLEFYLYVNALLLDALMYNVYTATTSLGLAQSLSPLLLLQILHHPLTPPSLLLVPHSLFNPPRPPLLPL